MKKANKKNQSNGRKQQYNPNNNPKKQTIYENRNKNNNKQNERLKRKQCRKEKNRKQYGDAEWKREFDLFLDQLKIIGLTIKDVAGDGNCLFRAIADQMEGNPNKHPAYRRRICEFIEANRDDYEPFLEDDEIWEEYLPRMKANGTWGGQMEIQAFSLAYSVNITIHQLGQPRWDIVNFYGMKTIHLSYHQGEHYSSVRKIGDVNYVPEAPKEINLYDSKKTSMKPPHEEKQNITPEELLVMEATGCQNKEFILALLIENWSDVAATVEFILTVGPDNIEFQHEYLAEKQQEKENSKSPRYPSTASTTTTSNQIDSQIEEEKSLRKEKKENVHPHKKKKEESDEVPDCHPKLAKFKEKNLSNKERKEKAKQEKQTLTEKPPPPLPVEAVDTSTIVQDLGSMQI